MFEFAVLGFQFGFNRFDRFPGFNRTGTGDGPEDTRFTDFFGGFSNRRRIAL